MFVKEIMNNRIKVSFGNADYKGHYVRTPYSFSPTVGIKLVANPCVDFGQGVLECIEALHHQLIAAGELDPHPRRNPTANP
jgi:UDP-glucose 4-epimerase